MPKLEEIRREWKDVRSTVGNLICYIEGKIESLRDLETAYQKGYASGVDEQYRKDRETITQLVDDKEHEFQTGYDLGYKDGANDEKEIYRLKRDERAYQDWYQNGLEAAWSAARKIVMEYDWQEVFADSECDTVFDIPIKTVVERLAEYEEEKKRSLSEKIELGDEVEALDTGGKRKEWVKFVACGDIGDGTIMGFDGKGGIFEYPRSACRKTGKHFDFDLG